MEVEDLINWILIAYAVFAGMIVRHNLKQKRK